ncbi:MAG TPA: hypothetical protein VLY04_01750 [Bryobacteraceae bacterium]|nr:hypothetical protein [Bryobacteraceae bacterium]
MAFLAVDPVADFLVVAFFAEDAAGCTPQASTPIAKAAVQVKTVRMLVFQCTKARDHKNGDRGDPGRLESRDT